MSILVFSEYSERTKDEGDEKDRSQCPFEEQSLQHPTGSVKHQLKQIEQVCSNLASTTTLETAKPSESDLNLPESSANIFPAMLCTSASANRPAKSTANVAGATQPSAHRPPMRIIPAQENVTISVTTGTNIASSVINPVTEPAALTPVSSEAAPFCTSGDILTLNVCVSSTITSEVNTNSKLSTAEKDFVSQLITSKSGSGLIQTSSLPLNDNTFESQTFSSACKEDIIVWSTGTVKQHREAIENKLIEKSESVSTSRRESQSFESASHSVEGFSLHCSDQFDTPTVETVSEKLMLCLKKLDPAKSPPHEEQSKRLFIMEKTPNSNISPKKGRNVKRGSKSCPIGRSQSMKETKSKVVPRPRSHTDSSTYVEATQELSVNVSPLSLPCSPGKGGESSQDHSDSDCSEKSDGQSVKDLRGFFETKENAIDRNMRPHSIRGTESSQLSQDHKKVCMTASLDSVVVAPIVRIREETRDAFAIQESSCVASMSSNTDTDIKTNLPADPAAVTLSLTSESEQKVRRQHGKSHPLTRLAQEAGRHVPNNKGGHGGRRSSNPMYNTM